MPSLSTRLHLSYRLWSILFAATLIAAAGPALHAQNPATGVQSRPIGNINFGGSGNSQNSGPRSRIVRGKVEDKNGAPVKGALVYLKDAKTTRNVVTDDDGTYRFVQLSQNMDYELWAQEDKQKGPSKAISSFNNTMEIIMNLKLAEAEAPKPDAKPNAKATADAPAKP